MVEEIKHEHKHEDHVHEEKVVETKEEKIEEKKEQKAEDKKEEVKKIEKKKPRKNEAVARGYSMPISTKQSMAVCKFIKWKTTEKAISDLENVIKKKVAVPMKGEIPHRKGKIMSGRFPQNTSMEFIKLLKGLEANAREAGIENGKISMATASMASRPFGRFGAHRKKRTNVIVKIQLNDKMKNKVEKKMEIKQ